MLAIRTALALFADDRERERVGRQPPAPGAGAPARARALTSPPTSGQGRRPARVRRATAGCGAARGPLTRRPGDQQALRAERRRRRRRRRDRAQPTQPDALEARRGQPHKRPLTPDPRRPAQPPRLLQPCDADAPPAPLTPSRSLPPAPRSPQDARSTTPPSLFPTLPPSLPSPTYLDHRPPAGCPPRHHPS